MENKEKKRLLILDGNALIHRAYHALPPLTTKDGKLVNAVYGFLLVFFKVVREFQPDYVAATFDVKAPTFRHQQFKAYKAKRPIAPEDLYRQIPITKEVLSALAVPIYEKEGFEADDVIGTISRLAPKKQVIPPLEVIIISGDLDSLQLIDNHTKVFALRKGVKDTVLYDENSVKEKYQGLLPEQLVDFKSLRGDPSDNIPGITGIGEKTAIELIKKFKSLENLYQILEEDKEEAEKIKPRVREMLQQQKEQAFFSKSLVEIHRETPIDFNLGECRWNAYNKEKVIQLLKKLEFYSLIKKLPIEETRPIKENLKLL